MQTMLMLPKNMSRILLSLMLGVGALVAVTSTPAAAQVNRTEPLEDLRTKDSADFFNGRGYGQGSSIMNFIQNAIIGTPRSMDEFSSEQKENFDEATAQFRKQQAELMRKRQSQVAPTAPIVPTTPIEMPPSSN